jgi:magnesium-protoporphyrin O-methyltransferase
MHASSYDTRRQQVTTYFDQTAARAWQALTSDAPVNRIRQTVRAGRDAMRTTLLDWLPADLRGRRLLDAGCGTGALAVEAAMRGAEVVAVDVAQNLIDVARQRLPDDLGPGSVDFRVGDMCDPGLGEFDHVVAMDSLIHYSQGDIAGALVRLCARTRHSVLCTYAPRTPALAAMHWVGRLVPHSANRAPAIVPVPAAVLARQLDTKLSSAGWQIVSRSRINSGFYISEAIQLGR